MKIFSFVFVQHFGLACGAALLFLVGALVAFPAVRKGPALLTRPPLILFRLVRRMLGPHPGMIRLSLLIFGFNGTAMLLYMASGLRPGIPAAISFMTGYNIAVIFLVAGGAEGLDDLSPVGRWRPSKWVAGLCGLAVIFLELPCFWYAIAMGIRLGQETASGRTAYMQGIVPRMEAYGILILPVLLVSAVCEAIAIQGMSASPPPSECGRWAGRPDP